MVDKAHRCYFLGIDVTTQSYICWIISNNQEKISAHVVFDEVTALKQQPSSLMLTVAAESRNPKDFEYLIGMVYRDDEDKLLYVSSRIAVQQSYIVVFSSTVCTQRRRSGGA